MSDEYFNHDGEGSGFFSLILLAVFMLGGFVVARVHEPGQNIGADAAKARLAKLEKIEAGARFFQTQTVYEPAAFEGFMRAVEQFRVPVLAGFIMLRSANMGRNFNANLPGVTVPDEILQEMDQADSAAQTSTEIAARIIKEIRPMCQGVHIMATGWESRIPQVLDAAGITDANRRLVGQVTADDLFTLGMPDFFRQLKSIAFIAEFDPLRDEGETYGERLKAAGVPTTVTRYAGMIHGFFGMFAVMDKSREAIRQVSDALKNAFAK